MGSTMTEKREYMKSKFKFLTDYGFTNPSIQQTNIVLILEYKKGELILSASYDFRDEFIDIYLQDINNHDVVHLLTNILDANIRTDVERKRLKESLNNIYRESKKYKYGMPIALFETIVTLYADFVERNIKEITAWRYDKIKTNDLPQKH
jgi:hypothetical protein